MIFSDPLTFKQDVKSSVEPIIIYRINDPTSSISLYINPQRISIRQGKVMQQVQTNTGWVFQHWGYEPIVISYSGVTGYINPYNIGIDTSKDTSTSLTKPPDPNMIPTPYSTPAYKALAKLRDFYEAPQKQLQGMGADLTKITSNIDAKLKQLALKFLYRADAYDGYLTRFEFNESEDSPWMWNYTMEFKAYNSNYNVDSLELNILQSYMDEANKAGIIDDSILKNSIKNILNTTTATTN
jgi:hypothetical protein